jgi:hypothetical protein
MGRHFAQFRRFFDGVSFTSKEVLGECVQDVDAVAEISFANRDVHADDLVLVGLVDLKRWLQDV